ncbi:type I-C CRISPR-associated protein Cas8c/Csd1 [Nonomuraea sp. NPDC049655]|uniref:type I-C CRISPR-associated protein Cas8c/Csd1 n=1 Tax=Nonomuraea sp. NPDC049655 TaxID=3364355 RepID=UPI0037AF124C
MLIKQLAAHADARDDLPPPYYRVRSVRWVIDLEGASVRLIDLSTPEAKAGQLLATPYVQRSGTGSLPFLLTDTLQYALGIPKDDSYKQVTEAERRNGDFVRLINEWAQDEPLAAPLVRFFTEVKHRQISAPEQASPSDVVAFRTSGGWLHDLPSAITAWGRVVRGRKSSSSGTGVCLSCGLEGTLLDTIPEPVKPGAIPVADGRGRDAQLVSINKSAQGRGGRIQLANTPICDTCGSRSMAALNALLADPHHRHRDPDSVTTWWLRKAAPIEPFASVRDARPEQVKEIINQVQLPPARRASWLEGNQFHAITLSANQSRVVIRDWIDIPLLKVCQNINAWFDEHAMSDLWSDGPQHVPAWRMAASLGRHNGQSYVKDSGPKGADRDLMTAALRRTRLPEHLLPRIIQRVRADGRVDLPRAALLRIILRRAHPALKEVLVDDLNLENRHPGYLSGRLFAILEDVQRAALIEINTTIADKFFGAAMGRPLSVLTMLRKNATGHLRRLRRTNRPAGVALDQRMDEVLTLFPAGGIPALLDLPGQGMFVLGYHQQRAADRAAARKAAASKAAAKATAAESA